MKSSSDASDKSPSDGLLEPPADAPDAEQPQQIAGYNVEDLLVAPIKPPEPVKTEGRQATQNRSVLFLMGLGTVLFITGVILILTFSTVFGLIVALLGGVAVAIAVFAPFRD